MLNVRPFYFAFALCLLLVPAVPATVFSQTPEVLRWAGDAEGGAPFRRGRSRRPSRVVGFDVDVAELIARGLGRQPQLYRSGLRPNRSVHRPGRRRYRAERHRRHAGAPGRVTPSRFLIISFAKCSASATADAGQFRSLGRSCAAAASARSSGTIAYDILLAAERDHGIVAVSYEDDVHPYSDLLIGRLDAVLLDNVLAERRQPHHPGFVTHADAVAVSHYVGVLAPENAALRDRINRHSASRRCATAASKRSSGSGRSGTTISRRLFAQRAARANRFHR